MRSRFDGRWLNTIVLSRPNRSPSQPAVSSDAVYRMPTTKNTSPTVASDAWNLVVR
jgi:hypothetical protein